MSSLTMSSLTDDLMSEILARLPVKSLLRFKLVSKPWRALISSPRFIKTHIRHAISRPGADQSLLVYKKDDLSISLLDLKSSRIGPRLGVPYSRGDFSFTPFTKLFGSHDGVVCVSVAHFARHEVHNADIYLWNPATRQSKLVPPHSIREGITSVSVGFGFDSVGNEFKVVRVVCSFRNPFSAEVYSQKRNAWRRVKIKPFDVPYYDEFDVCVQGLLCCTGMYGLMAFDLDKEVFKSHVKLPVLCRDIKRYNARLTVVNDSIAVAFFSRDREFSGRIKLWTLDDDECLHCGQLQASWTPVLSVRVDIPGSFVRGCFNSGDLLLVIGEKTWLSYNPKKKEAKPVPDSIYMSQVIRYNESLVSIGESKQVQ